MFGGLVNLRRGAMSAGGMVPHMHYEHTLPGGGPTIGYAPPPTFTAPHQTMHTTPPQGQEGGCAARALCLMCVGLMTMVVLAGASTDGPPMPPSDVLRVTPSAPYSTLSGTPSVSCRTEWGVLLACALVDVIQQARCQHAAIIPIAPFSSLPPI